MCLQLSKVFRVSLWRLSTLVLHLLNTCTDRETDRQDRQKASRPDDKSEGLFGRVALRSPLCYRYWGPWHREAISYWVNKTAGPTDVSLSETWSRPVRDIAYWKWRPASISARCINTAGNDWKISTGVAVCLRSCREAGNFYLVVNFFWHLSLWNWVALVWSITVGCVQCLPRFK